MPTIAGLSFCQFHGLTSESRKFVNLRHPKLGTKEKQIYCHKPSKDVLHAASRQPHFFGTCAITFSSAARVVFGKCILFELCCYRHFLRRYVPGDVSICMEELFVECQFFTSFANLNIKPSRTA